jgi:hypothetical protein
VSDRGAKALGLAVDRHNEEQEPFSPVHCNTGDDCHLAILGTTGLFIPDVTKHEPEVRGDDVDSWVECSCGHMVGPAPESYFDHITAHPDSTGARE